MILFSPSGFRGVPSPPRRWPILVDSAEQCLQVALDTEDSRISASFLMLAASERANLAVR